MNGWKCAALALVVGCGSDDGPKPLPLSADDTAVAGADTAEPTADPPLDDTGTSPPDDTGDESRVSTAMATVELDPSDWSDDPSRTRNNALKGFITSYLWGAPVTDFPDQMEFLYLPLNQLWSAEGDTLEATLEPLLVAAAERNHHAVLRVFVDYPNRPSGLPEYLEGTVGCSPYAEHGGGCSPDYDDPELVAAMVGLIEALGDRYDGDPRLGIVQLGLLGFWGEWHTWPHTDWFPSEATQAAVLDAYEAAFETTLLQIRRPAIDSVERRMGFHDDSFAHSTLGDIGWFFLPGLEAAGAAERWQEVPIGGELRPELQSSVFSDGYVLGEYTQDVFECIEQTHTSYLLNYYAFNGEEHGYLGDDRSRAEDAAIAMGYRFELAGASIALSALEGDTVDATAVLQFAQTGVAPFYYPLLASMSSEALAEPAVSDADLSTLLPGESRSVEVPLGRIAVDSLDEPFGLKLTSPMLSEAQQVLLSTLTPWTEADGPTAVQWTIQCEAGGHTYDLGQVVEGSGGDCRCDVDGVVRTFGGDTCSDSAR